MTTQTLPKPRTAGAREAQPVSVLPPEKLFPARAKLAAKLDQIERALGDLSDYTARSERAGIDENQALEDEELSENEAAEKIQTAQLQKNIFKARIANREKAIVTFSAELATAINESAKELHGLTSAETSRREDIIRGRILEVLEPGKAIDRAFMGRPLAELLSFSGAVQAVKDLEPPLGIVSANTETKSLVSLAKGLLSKFERIIAETGRNL
jgi:hypothetical protein